jgi:hypothetical protein
VLIHSLAMAKLMLNGSVVIPDALKRLRLRSHLLSIPLPSRLPWLDRVGPGCIRLSSNPYSPRNQGYVECFPFSVRASVPRPASELSTGLPIHLHPIRCRRTLGTTWVHIHTSLLFINKSSTGLRCSLRGRGHRHRSGNCVYENATLPDLFSYSVRISNEHLLVVSFMIRPSRLLCSDGRS